MKFSLIDPGIYEICGGGRTGLRQQNRVGKTFIMAYGAWLAEEQGLDVYCNCPTNPVTEQVDHILNIPHYDYDPYQLIFTDLYDDYVMTDQAEQVMDSAASGKREIRQLVYFAYQAKKRGLRWRFDTPRHKNIVPRVRFNPDVIIYPERIPTNWHQPLKAIRLVIKMADIDRHYFLRFNNPQDYFCIYNEKVMLRPTEN